MRLGAYPANLKPGSLANRIYDSAVISERHRHRYEFNRAFEEILTRNGLIISGVSPDKNFVEIVETRGPSVVPRLPVPSGVQIEAAGAASAVRLVRWRGLRTPAGARDRQDRYAAKRIVSYTIPDFKLDLQKDFFLIAGPCVIESRDHVLFMASELKKIDVRVRRSLRFQGLVRQSQPQLRSNRSAGRESTKA